MARYLRSLVCLLTCSLVLSGCGGSYEASRSTEKSDVGESYAVSAGKEHQRQGERFAAAKSAAVSDTTAKAAGPESAQLKIIYVADISLVVDDFGQAEKRIPDLVTEFRGYMSDVSVARSTGYSRSGRWVVRIPVDRFDAFLNALGQLGVPESRRQNAQDVTEEYVDLEARIKNNKRLEERILKLIEERSGEIKEVVEAERELARVRGEIEQMEGRLRYLQNRTSLSTVTISVREERDYEPPEAPTFADRITAGWTDSLIALREFGEDAAVFLVTSAPWIVLWAILLVPVFWFLRRKWRRAVQRWQATREPPPAAT